MFIELEIQDLFKNKYAKNINSKCIIYANEFKLQFI